MNYSPEARKALTEACEGFPPKIYLDPAGIPTGGYGHTKGLTANMVGQPVSATLADTWVQEDIAGAELAVNHCVGVKLTQHQFDALVDFTFNVGQGNLRTSTLLRLVNWEQYPQADLEFAKWVNGGGHRLPGLVARRALVAKWFNIKD